MPADNLLRFLLAAVSCAAAAATIAQSNEWQRDERAREHFLCQWKQANIQGPVRALDFCGSPDLDLGLSLVQQDGFWGEQPRALKMRFEADLANSSEMAERTRQRHESQERARIESARRKAAENSKRAHLAMEKRTQFDLAVPNMSETDLCMGLHDNGYESAHTELQKRKTFTAREWELIETQKIAIGMSQSALICSWGNTRANRTLTANSQRLQYVYGSSTYVYVVNGIITSIQDTQ